MEAVDNETWIIETGDVVIQKKAQTELDDWEKMVECLWVADYGMRNAGDLEGGLQIRPDFQSVGTAAAETLGLTNTHAFFSLPAEEFQIAYFANFELICSEIRSLGLNR